MSGAVSPFFLCFQVLPGDNFLYKTICYKINIDRRYAKVYTTAALTDYVPYYYTAHVTEGCTTAVRLVTWATKFYRWRLILKNNYCSLFLMRKELCRSSRNEQAVPDYSDNKVEQWYVRHYLFIVLNHTLHVSTYIQVIFRPSYTGESIKRFAWWDPIMLIDIKFLKYIKRLCWSDKVEAGSVVFMTMRFVFLLLGGASLDVVIYRI
jgi:hypothetical protein